MSRNKYPEETVNLILDVSQRLFIEKGYDNTTIQDIIDELGGLTKGAIYHHFSSKQDILDAVIERLFAKNTLSASWRKIQSDTDITGGEKLKRMLAAALTDEQVKIDNLLFSRPFCSIDLNNSSFVLSRTCK